MNTNEKIKELTLMLIYLTSWKDKQRWDESEHLCAWKGYNFDVLNEFDDEELVFGSRKSKKVYISEKGVEQAKRLLVQYGIEEAKGE